MTLRRGPPDLIDLSHEALFVDPLRPDRDFEMTQRLVTDLTPIPARGSSSWSRSLRGHMTAQRPSIVPRRASAVTVCPTPVPLWVGLQRAGRSLITSPSQVAP
jgi:hypothetical protein